VVKPKENVSYTRHKRGMMLDTTIDTDGQPHRLRLSSSHSLPNLYAIIMPAIPRLLITPSGTAFYPGIPKQVAIQIEEAGGSPSQEEDRVDGQSIYCLNPRLYISDACLGVLAFPRLLTSLPDSATLKVELRKGLILHDGTRGPIQAELFRVQLRSWIGHMVQTEGYRRKHYARSGKIRHLR